MVVALLMSVSAAFAVVHVVATIGFVAFAVLSRRAEAIVVVSAYIVGVENLWRLTASVRPYELPNFLLLVLLLGLLRVPPRLRFPLLPAVFVALLVPAAAMTVVDLGVAEARERISFTLLPLVVLALAVAGLGRFQVTDEFRRRIAVAVVAPTTGLAFLVFVRLLGSGDLSFGNASNFAASGGFAPNRVAASLAFAAVLCLLEATREKKGELALIEIGLAVWLASQSALTFSRGGVLSAILALGVGFVYQAWRRRHLARGFVVVSATALVILQLVLPRLDAFTGGALEQRFSTLETERTSLAEEDLRLFRTSPVLGIGAGKAAFARSTGVVTPSHTEYTRLLAEHGILGIVAIGMLLAMAFVALRRAAPAARPYAATLLVWSLTQMMYANLRISAVAFAFGLACLAPVVARPPDAVHP